MQNYLLLLNTGIALFIAGLSLRRSNIASSIHLSVLASVTAFWSLVYLLYNLQLFNFPKQLFISLIYLVSQIAASTLLTFSLTYSHRGDWIKRLTIVTLLIEPLVTQILFWIEPTRDLFFMGRTVASVFLSLDSGLWANINAIYLYSFEIGSLLLLTDVFSRKPHTMLMQSGTLLAGAFAPLIFRLFDHVSQSQMALFEHSIIGYSMAIIGLAIGLYRHHVIQVEPVTCETVVKAMSDGWMVLDLNSNIVDANPAAEKIVGIPRHRLYGKPVRSILPDWPDISNIVGGGKELEMRRSVRTQDSWRYLNVRLSNLLDYAGNPFGQLIIWRDITDRKLVEEARQRARDEMFVLLNAISNAASHSIMLDDFLSESIYQIIYPFQSQVVGIFLLEDGNEKNHQDRQFRLAAHFGLAPDGMIDIETFYTQTWIFDEVVRTKQPIIVGGTQDDNQLPAILREAEIASLIILPLLTQAGENSRLLGCMLLGRKNNEAYSQDEVIRLMTIAEQIANLIDSDRRRQLAIALSEREKLMRDLHDSVSQKLYGLVTLTEAAQAALEAGSKVVPSQVLAKIGENARQAVKEMRLFLYQMQPVDLEKGDLISALHHRLGAVEGRADIQARFMPDEGVSVSKDKEIALYYIAQEALNNILKHARANTVLVKLRQTRKNVILEVIDNGEGFDPQKADKSGIGLQNMRSRTAQINGQLKIISKPGLGTTIKVMVGREKVSNQLKNRR